MNRLITQSVFLDSRCWLNSETPCQSPEKRDQDLKITICWKKSCVDSYLQRFSGSIITLWVLKWTNDLPIIMNVCATEEEEKSVQPYLAITDRRRFGNDYAVDNTQVFGAFRLKPTNEHHLPQRGLSAVWTSHHCSEFWHLARAKARAFFLPVQTFSVVACFSNRPLIWWNWTLSVVNEHAGGSPKPPKLVVFPISWPNQKNKNFLNYKNTKVA